MRFETWIDTGEDDSAPKVTVDVEILTDPPVVEAIGKFDGDPFNRRWVRRMHRPASPEAIRTIVSHLHHIVDSEVRKAMAE